MKNRKRILSVTLKRIVDDSPDTSWLGEYSNRPENDFAIDRKHSLDCIENDTPQKDKLQRIAEAIENDSPICDGHGAEEDSEDRPICLEELAYTQARDEVLQLAECDCGERGDMGRNEYRYFNPSFNYVDKNGKPIDDNTPEDVRKYTRQDYDRMESLNRGDFCFIGISAKAEIGLPCGGGSYLTQSLESGGLWGIESDSDSKYIEEVEQEKLSELKQVLREMGFSTRAISKAFQNVERKDS